MVNRIIKVWSFVGWYPLGGFLSKFYPYRSDDAITFWLTLFVLHVVAISTINFIVNGKFTYWFKG